MFKYLKFLPCLFLLCAWSCNKKLQEDVVADTEKLVEDIVKDEVTGV